MNYKDEYKKWLSSPTLSAAESEELKAVIDEKEIENRFLAPLSFGTAGLRGIMAAGLNRMNIHVIRQATQGFAQLVCEQGKEAMKRGVVVCFDSRINSLLFAKEAASVLAGNGVKAYIFDALRPTPELSFAIRELKAIAGINITASHNTKEYNGYKVYWEDGAQLPPEHAAVVAEAMSKIDIFDGIKRLDYEKALNDGLITIIGEHIDEKFLECVLAQSINREMVCDEADALIIVYTPFHGAGYRLVPEALKRLGIKNLYPVPEQMELDGSFPTVKSPNPEYAEGFHLAVALAKKVNASLIIGTDPDSDRLGVMVKKGEEYVTLSGNQMGVLLLDYIISAKKRAGTLPSNAATLKSFVTTKMADKVAKMNGVYIEDTFTGFKYMAEKIKEFEESGKYRTIFSFEESYGYLIGEFVRDKDAVTASMLTAEMAAFYNKSGMTLYDAMEALYEKYGYFTEKTVYISMAGFDGLEKTAALMRGLRENPPQEIGGYKVLKITDYQSGTVIDTKSGETSKAKLVGSDTMYFELEGEACFIVRPSGTEPKVKVYVMAEDKSRLDCDVKAAKIEAYVQNL